MISPMALHACGTSWRSGVLPAALFSPWALRGNKKAYRWNIHTVPQICFAARSWCCILLPRFGRPGLTPLRALPAQFVLSISHPFRDFHAVQRDFVGDYPYIVFLCPVVNPYSDDFGKCGRRRSACGLGLRPKWNFGAHLELCRSDYKMDCFFCRIRIKLLLQSQPSPFQNHVTATDAR